jgi:hypothetical protein
MKIKSFRKYEKASLKGFLELELQSGMCIRDLTYHVREDGTRWVGYPSKPYQDDEGNTKYQNQLYFPDRAVHGKFQKQVLAALDVYFASNQQATGTDGEVPF